MTIINVLLLTNDLEYNTRVGSYMMSHYRDIIRIAAIDSPDKVSGAFSNASFAVVLLGEEYKGLEIPELSGKAVGILTGSRAGDKPDSHYFCKYSSGPDIYKFVLGLYAEVSTASIKSDTPYRIFSFVSANGGAGSSSVAAGFAMHAASQGKKTLYIGLDEFAPQTGIFGEEGNSCMGDLIFFVMSSARKQINLSAKAAAVISTDDSGVSYLQGCRSANDFEEMDAAMLAKLIDACIESAEYECVVLDGPFVNPAIREFMIKRSYSLTFVTENQPSAFGRLKRYAEWIDIFDKRNGSEQSELKPRSNIIVNKSRVAAGDQSILGMRFIGSIPHYGDSSVRGIADAMSKLGMFGGLLSL